MLASRLSSSRTVGISLSVRLVRIGQDFGLSAGSWLEKKFASDLVGQSLCFADEGYQCS